MKDIDYEKLIRNLKTQINVLEYDSSRSAGKTMNNANTLSHMHALLERYEALVAPKKSVAKKAAAK